MEAFWRLLNTRSVNDSDCPCITQDVCSLIYSSDSSVSRGKLILEKLHMQQWFIDLYSKSCCICIISDFQRLQTAQFLNVSVSLYRKRTHSSILKMLPSISWSGGGGGGGASRSAVSPGNGGKPSSSERGRGGGREAQGKLFSSTTEDREET